MMRRRVFKLAAALSADDGDIRRARRDPMHGRRDGRAVARAASPAQRAERQRVGAIRQLRQRPIHLGDALSKRHHQLRDHPRRPDRHGLLGAENLRRAQSSDAACRDYSQWHPDRRVHAVRNALDLGSGRVRRRGAGRRAGHFEDAASAHELELFGDAGSMQERAAGGENPAQLGYNGILGVGLWGADCGGVCASLGPQNPAMYFRCRAAAANATSRRWPRPNRCRTRSRCCRSTTTAW